jgi:hypothetical protein
MLLNEKSPCDKCKFSQNCKQYELACRAFSSFMLHGTFKADTVRGPTAQLYNKIFNEDDKALRNYLKSIRMKEEMAKK